MMKTYHGLRTHIGCLVVVQEPFQELRLLDGCHRLFNHSPDGFEWGYCGSGPAQLSLALLWDVFEDDRLALDLHQAYKAAVVVGLPHDLWSLTEGEVFNVGCYLRQEQRFGSPEGA